MRAKLKIKYGEINKGSVFNLLEAQGRRITLDINGIKTDFGFSEVEIIAENDNDLFLLGQNILHNSKKSIAGWRESDVTKLINEIDLPIKKSLMRRAVNFSIWGK